MIFIYFAYIAVRTNSWTHRRPNRWIAQSLRGPSLHSSFDYLWTHRTAHRWVPQDLWGSNCFPYSNYLFYLALFSFWTHRTPQWVPHRRTFNIKIDFNTVLCRRAFRKWFSLGELSVSRFRAKDIFSLVLNSRALHRWVPHWTFGRHFLTLS